MITTYYLQYYAIFYVPSLGERIKSSDMAHIRSGVIVRKTLFISLIYLIQMIHPYGTSEKEMYLFPRERQGLSLNRVSTISFLPHSIAVLESFIKHLMEAGMERSVGRTSS